MPIPADGYGQVHCEPGWSWQPTLADYDMWLVLAGQGTLELAGQRFPLGAGCLLFLRPGDQPRVTQDRNDRLRVSYTHFAFTDPGHQPTVLPDDLLPERCLRNVDLARVGSLMGSLASLRRDPHPLRQFTARGTLAALLVEVYLHDARQAGQPVPVLDERIEAVLAFIADNLHRRPALREVAALVSLSPGRTSKLFADQVGTSMREYVVAARLERARVLLRETTMTSGQVASALGYHDAFLFSRQFKRRYGQAPSHYTAAGRQSA